MLASWGQWDILDFPAEAELGVWAPGRLGETGKSQLTPAFPFIRELTHAWSNLCSPPQHLLLLSTAI